MHILTVMVHVKPECVEAFKAATELNSRGSNQEAGVARFDLLQQQDDPTRFLLFEVYHDAQDHASHRETAHYNAWREAVEPMMAEPRVATRYTNLYPGDESWG